MTHEIIGYDVFDAETGERIGERTAEPPVDPAGVVVPVAHIPVLNIVSWPETISVQVVQPPAG